LIGKNVVKIHNGDAIDHSMNNDRPGDSGRHHNHHPISQQVELTIGRKDEKIRNGVFTNYSINDYTYEQNAKSYDCRRGCGNQREGEYKNTTPRQKLWGWGKRERASAVAAAAPPPSNKERSGIGDCHAISNFLVSRVSSSRFMMKQDDCLDTTFDSIESYACNDKTGEIYPVGGRRPSSPIFLYEQQQPLDERFGRSEIEVSNDDRPGKQIQVIENNKANDDSDGLEEICNASITTEDGNKFSKTDRAIDRPGLGVGFMNEKRGDSHLRRGSRLFDKLSGESCEDPETSNNLASNANNSLFTTFDASDSDAQNNCESRIHLDKAEPHHSQQRSTFDDSFPSRINRENSLLDVESGGGAGKCKISTSPSLKNKKDRLEQLRQNKRDIETRVSLTSQNDRQTIVIPRSSVYCSEAKEEEVCAEESKCYKPISKLQVSASVSKEQEKEFYLRQRIFLTATISLVSVGLLMVAMALFWPARMS